VWCTFHSSPNPHTGSYTHSHEDSHATYCHTRTNPNAYFRSLCDPAPRDQYGKYARGAE
jgi:hypothetical protein